MAPLSRRKNQDVDLLKELISILSFYSKFAVNDQTGIALNEQSMKEDHYRQLIKLQHVSFRNFKEHLKELSLTNLGSIETREDLLWHFEPLSEETLVKLCDNLEIRSQPVGIDIDIDLKDYLIEVLIAEYEKPESPTEKVKKQPIYPDEKVIFDTKLTQMSRYIGDRPLALPKLNLQYLTLGDYLLRNHQLFKLESIYNIRQDIEDAVKRLSPRMKFPECKTEFAGKARMATLIDSFNIVDIADAKLGDDKPAHVRADVTFNIGTYARNMRNEWDSLRKQDTLFLVTIEATEDSLNMMGDNESFREHYGVKSIRGCEIVDFIGADGRSIDEISRPAPEDRKDKLKGSERTVRVELDSNQYKLDMNNFTKKHSDDVYSTFNILIRRKTEENNFKSMLETMCELLQAETTIPEWLYKVFLGYGDQKSSKKSKKAKKEALPEIIQIESHKLPINGPYGYDTDKEDQIPLSPKHKEAVYAGMSLGLTVITGSSDTEKTNVAAHIVESLYRNFPKQRTLVITHSNDMLDALFEKVPDIGVESQHIIRIGHGDQELGSEVSFSKYSRIAVTLERRVTLLQEVDQLASSLNVSGEHGSTCETAGHFYQVHIQPRWENFLKTIESADSIDKISSAFPFSQFYVHSAKPVFTESMSVEEALESANGCKRYFDDLFCQLESIRPFELLRYDYDRANYLLTKETKVIGVMSAHAALKRSELVKHKFKYDNIVLLEADQTLEIETFVSLQLQEPNDVSNNLKRITIIGDNRKSPIVNNTALEKYGNLNQSMFKRFVQLGAPVVCLD
ncbi:hypothetical protein BY458DRAFT_445736 [Sporodiniella umbellata]|nr:hypothetical protein BY458DRAFT_445736 [Sporodiniella umbellata]